MSEKQKPSMGAVPTALSKCCDVLQTLASRDAAIAVGFLADAFIGPAAAQACYAAAPIRSAKERAADKRKSAEALIREAEQLEAEEDDPPPPAPRTREGVK